MTYFQLVLIQCVRAFALCGLASVLICQLDICFNQTVSGLGTFFLAMVLFPEIQAKAQKEIDQHCHGRLPSFADYSVLQYVHAIVKEALRWRPVVPLGRSKHATLTSVSFGLNVMWIFSGAPSLLG